MTLDEIENLSYELFPEGYRSFTYARRRASRTPAGLETECTAYIDGQHFSGPTWKSVAIRVKAFKETLDAESEPGIQEAP